jgi:hypothetical protein
MALEPAVEFAIAIAIDSLKSAIIRRKNDENLDLKIESKDLYIPYAIQFGGKKNAKKKPKRN